MIKKFRTFMGDFETTVYEGQTKTEVWASALVEFGTEDVMIFHSIDDTFDYLKSLGSNVKCFYHNLKFDGAFWIDFLIKKGLKQATFEVDDIVDGFLKVTDMPNNTFTYSISDMGQWYSITIKTGRRVIILQDSLKLLPFSVKRIGESFQTKHKKLDMEYTGFRYAGCEITPEEQKYIANDVLVVKEALEMMQSEGHNKLTIGSCCLEEFKKTFIDRFEYDGRFPDLSKVPLDENIYKYDNVDKYVRRSYRGGWCYVVSGKENQIKHFGTTADVNSLYPSMMHSESGNKYPIGNAHFWKGNFIPDDALRHYYFVRVKTRFYLKEGYLPFIQLKGNGMYIGHECLETSDILDRKTGLYCNCYYDRNGNLHDTRVEMVLTMTDYELIKKHYELVDFEILDGCYFFTETGLFDKYIDKYKKIKMENKGAKRELAKLFLNNLYGKMASGTNSSFKVAFEKEDGSISFYTVLQDKKKVGYIPIGSAITSYARCFTITAAQNNYYGKNAKGFIYADTDSIHCDLRPEEIKGIKVHPTAFCCWKLESCWDEGIFVRQKTYIEHITHEDEKPIENPYYNIKCAGMPQKCKDMFVASIEGSKPKDYEKYNKEEKEFIDTKRDLTDFKIGLKITGKLLPKRIEGGIVLVETTFEMR